MRRIIAVMSGKGGVGKTVSTLNLSAALHNLNENVTVIDADLNNPNVGLQLGLYNFPTTLNDVLERDMSIMEALHIHPSGLRIIPSSISLKDLHTNPRDVARYLESLEGFVLVDCAPGFGREVISVLEACDEVLIVTNPIFPSVVGCMRLIEVAKELNKPIRGIIVNQLGFQEVSHQEIGSVCGAPVIGTVPYDRNVDKSIITKQPLVSLNPYSSAALGYQKIASELAGKDFSPPRFAKIKSTIKAFRK